MLPESIYYWLGYRIVEEYLKKYPGTTMKDLSYIPYSEIYKNSKYGELF